VSPHLVDERRRCQQRLRWHLDQLDPAYRVPAGAVDRAVWLDRIARWLACRPAEVQVRVARELVARCRSLTRSITDLDRDVGELSAQIAPRLLELPAALVLPPPSCWPRSVPSHASTTTLSSPGTAVSHHSRRARVARNATDSTATAD
jgi:hypothetical protein